MKAKAFLTTLLAFGAIVTVGCGSDEGLGGDSEIHFTVQHHTAPIPNATVYIKYGVKTSPGENPSSYDASVMADSVGHGMFGELQKGDYYLYGIGYDSAISMVVTGGVPVEIKRNGDEKDVTIAVIE